MEFEKFLLLNCYICNWGCMVVSIDDDWVMLVFGFLKWWCFFVVKLLFIYRINVIC